MNRFTVITCNEEETKALGRRIGSRIKAGDTVALTGDLGAGKTHFTMGVAESLGISDYITSPTFTVVNEYRTGKMPLFHFDAYRLSGPEELFDIGYEDYAAERGVILIEWADRVADALPEQTVWIRIERQDETDIDRRRITVTWPEGDERFADIGN